MPASYARTFVTLHFLRFFFFGRGTFVTFFVDARELRTVFVVVDVWGCIDEPTAATVAALCITHGMK